MLFDLQNYWLFLIAVSIGYVITINFLQARIGGKDRLKKLQEEMRENQKRMIEASKNKNTKESDELMSQYWKMTSELMGIQLKLTAVFLLIFFALTAVFPHLEPNGNDDIPFALYDDGLASHCDLLAGDGNYSGCLLLPAGSNKGAWTVDIHLKSETNETLAKSATALYVNDGKPEDIWLQNSTQSGIIDGLLGKKPYHLNVTSDRENITLPATVSFYATVSPSLPLGARIEASANSGTFIHLDLPFAIPLINIRRIIGSYGIFIFLAFAISIIYSIGKSIYAKIAKK